jgi:hypothetical protein
LKDIRVTKAQGGGGGVLALGNLVVPPLPGGQTLAGGEGRGDGGQSGNDGDLEGRHLEVDLYSSEKTGFLELDY